VGIANKKQVASRERHVTVQFNHLQVLMTDFVPLKRRNSLTDWTATQQTQMNI
jgi:hypothetical protein